MSLNIYSKSQLSLAEMKKLSPESYKFVFLILAFEVEFRWKFDFDLVFDMILEWRDKFDIVVTSILGGDSYNIVNIR